MEFPEERQAMRQRLHQVCASLLTILQIFLRSVGTPSLIENIGTSKQ